MYSQSICGEEAMVAKPKTRKLPLSLLSPLFWARTPPTRPMEWHHPLLLGDSRPRLIILTYLPWGLSFPTDFLELSYWTQASVHPCNSCALCMLDVEDSAVKRTTYCGDLHSKHTACVDAGPKLGRFWYTCLSILLLSLFFRKASSVTYIAFFEVTATHHSPHGFRF